MAVTGNPGGGPRTGIEHAVVIGAGAAGLAAALEMSRLGLEVTVVERARVAGGRSRTLEFMGCRFDTGPQPLFSDDPEVESLWGDLLAGELVERSGSSRILYRGRYLDSPVGLLDALASLEPLEAVRCLMSLAQARLNPIEQPQSLSPWAWNRLGDRLFSEFYVGYLEKVYGRPVSELSMDWSGDWLEPLQPAPSSFSYPRLGSGELWRAAAARLQASGHRIRLGEQLVAVRHAAGRVIAVTLRDGAGRTVELVGSQFLSTLGVADLIASLSPAAPCDVRRAAEALRYRDLLTVNVVLDRAEAFDRQWIDVFEPSVAVSRVSNFKNFSEAMVADPGLTGLGMEYFCHRGDELWSSADAELLDLGRRELVALGICRPEDVKAGMVQRHVGALAEVGDARDEGLNLIADWLEGTLPNLWVAGESAGPRGEWQQVESIREGMVVARNIASARAAAADRSGPAPAGTLAPEAVDILVGFRSGVAQR